MSREVQTIQTSNIPGVFDDRVAAMFTAHRVMGLCRGSEIFTVSCRFNGVLTRFSTEVRRTLIDIDPDSLDPFIVPEYRNESAGGIAEVVKLMDEEQRRRFTDRGPSWQRHSSQELGWTPSGPARIGALVLPSETEDSQGELSMIEERDVSGADLRLRPATPADIVSTIVQNVVSDRASVWPYPDSVRALDLSASTRTLECGRKSALHLIHLGEGVLKFTARPSEALRHLSESEIYRPSVLELV